MDLREALEKVTRVLEEEQIQPTLGYRYVSATWPSNSAYMQQVLRQQGYGPAQAAQLGLATERKQRPRHVYEDPKLYVFESTNFALLIKIFSQVAETDRAAFVSDFLNYVQRGIGAQRHKFGNPFPSFQGQTSALALIAEFCIRTGYLKELLAATVEPKMPTTSLAIMLKEIEEMIALNFNLFSDSELAAIPSGLAHLRDIAERQTYSARGTRGGPMKENPHYRQGFSDVGNEIVEAIDGITEECRKARFWYLKGALQELPNLEIESDRLKVEGFLTKLGFSAEMVKTLNAAESDYKSTANAFELKNCLGHLRSFLEHLHRESVKSIAKAAGQTVVDRWGDATLYLRQQGFFTKQHETFVTSLYTLLSDESIHPLTAEKEYARLLRNVVIEYGVMFLTVLDKKGVTI
ncbi:MAG: hypothetical protein LAP21_18910 [Acidobacteriia bacterium]|nr:hypothetical protein [Terriglobia bacterium]